MSTKMPAPVEAKSLNPIINLASNPPAYPRNPTHEPLQPLALYIVRIPGSKDVYLTPQKPGSKDDISPESINASLYFLHVATPQDKEILEEIRRELEQSSNPKPEHGEDNGEAIIRRSMVSDNPELMRNRRSNRASLLSNYPPELQQMNVIRRKPVGSISKRSARTSSESGNANDYTTAATSPTTDAPSPVDVGVAEAAKAVMPYVGLKEDPEQQQRERRQRAASQLSVQPGTQTASTQAGAQVVAPQPGPQHQQPQTTAAAPQYVPYHGQPANQQQPTQQESIQDSPHSQPPPQPKLERMNWNRPMSQKQIAEQEQARTNQLQLQELLRRQEESQRQYARQHPDPNERPSAPTPPPKIPLTPSSPPPAYDEVYKPKKLPVQPPELPPRGPPLPPRQMYDRFTSTHQPRARSPSAASVHTTVEPRGPNFDSILRPENIVDHEAEEEEARKMAEAAAAAHAAAREKWSVASTIQAGKRFTSGLGRRATTGRRSRAFSLGSVKNESKQDGADGKAHRNPTITGYGSASASSLTPTNMNENDSNKLLIDTNALPAARTRVACAHKPTQSWDGSNIVAFDERRARSVRSKPSSDRLSPVVGPIAANSRRASPLRQPRESSSMRWSMDWFRGNQGGETQESGRNRSADTHAGSRGSSEHIEEGQPPAPVHTQTTAPATATAAGAGATDSLPAEVKYKPYHITMIRRDPSTEQQENVARITNANPENDDEVDPNGNVYIEILTPGYNRFAGNSNPLAQGGLGINLDNLPPALRESAKKAMAASGDTSFLTGDAAGAQQPAKPSGPLRFTRTLSLQNGHSRTESQQQPTHPSGRYAFMSPWHGQCVFSTGASGHSLKLRHSVTSMGAAGHLHYHRHQRRESSANRSRSRDRSPGNERVIPVVAAEIRFNLPLLAPAYAAVHAHHGRGKSIWNSKPFVQTTEREKAIAAAAAAASPAPTTTATATGTAHQGYSDGAPLSLVPTDATSVAETQSIAGQTMNMKNRPVDFSKPWDENAGASYGPQPVSQEQDKRMNLSLGRERGGGGIRGRSHKLGKLVLEDEGLKMMDLAVAACMGIWWNAYEAVDI